MFYADTIGLPQLCERISYYATTCGPRFWQPAALLGQLAAAGKAFSDGATRAPMARPDARGSGVRR